MLTHSCRSMSTTTSTLVSSCGGLALLLALSVFPACAEDGAPVRIGFSIARTGPNAVAARGSVEANYTLWSE